jgi:ATP-dependent RNA helicase DDX52/ROK1
MMTGSQKPDAFRLLLPGVQFDKKKINRDTNLTCLSKAQNSERGKRGAPAETALPDYFGDALVGRAPGAGEARAGNKEKPAARSSSSSSSPSSSSSSSSSGSSSNSSKSSKSSKSSESSSGSKKRVGARVTGNDPPQPLTSFSSLSSLYSARDYLLRNIARSGYEMPTAVQTVAIPSLCDKRDVLAMAPTGTGKTAAFAIPTLIRLKAPARGGFRAVIVSPTRELSKQTEREFHRLAEGKAWRIFCLSRSLQEKVDWANDKKNALDVLIATPDRLVTLIESGRVDLAAVELLVFDEADRLFEDGTVAHVDRIIAACSNPRVQRCLFSATIPTHVEELSHSVLRDPLRVSIGATLTASSNVAQRLVYTGSEDGKVIALRQLLRGGFKPPAIVFVQSVARAMQLYAELEAEPVRVDVIHSERTTGQREKSIADFRAGNTWVLICTELLSRGVDFKGINLVINYDFPQTVVSYIHRVGRTGRMGRRGEAITLWSDVDKPLIGHVARLIKRSGGDVPEWMLKLRKPTEAEKKRLKKRPPARAPIVPGKVFNERKRKRPHKKGQGQGQDQSQSSGSESGSGEEQGQARPKKTNKRQKK